MLSSGNSPPFLHRPISISSFTSSSSTAPTAATLISSPLTNPPPPSAAAPSATPAASSPTRSSSTALQPHRCSPASNVFAFAVADQHHPLASQASLSSPSSSLAQPFSRNVHPHPDAAQLEFAEDIDLRSHKRRRTASAAGISAAAPPATATVPPAAAVNSSALRQTPPSHFSLTPELTVGYLPSPSSSDGSYDAAAGHVSHAMDPVLLGGIYDYAAADNKMNPHPLDRSAASPSNETSGYGPFLGQYWNFVQGSIAHAGVPLSQNGNYVSPYCASTDPYFASAQNHGLGLAQEVHHSGVGSLGSVASVDGTMFGGHRNSDYDGTVVQDDHNMYPEPIGGSGWQYPTVDPTLQRQSIQLLDSLANQILRDVMTSTVQDFLTVATVPDTDQGQAYATVLALFEQNRKVFSRDHLFIDTSENSPYSDPIYLHTFRKANLATFVSCIFRGHDVPFLDLDDNFLDLFMPPGTRLLKSEGALCLELKTQAFVAIMLNSDASKEELLDRLFPRDMQLAILRRRSEASHLAPSEQDFIGRLNTRRQYLSAGSDTLVSLQQLPRKYSWKDFLDEVVICVRRALEAMDAIKDITAGDSVSTSTSISDSLISKPALAANAGLCGRKRSSSSAFSVSEMQQISHAQASPLLGGSKRTCRGSPISPGSAPFSASMTVQYEQARATTNVKAPPFNRRTGAPSQRRPWSQEEEKALMDGLDRVKGPHWSQILALYGAGGSISEVLKDRNQVQLKDKARNLKLFFLKSGIEVPVYLQRVTGELKTRAPAQAAKKEARERLQALEAERARLGLQPGEPLPPDREREVLQQLANASS